MARIRSIKPEIWLSPQVMNLSPLARLLFVGLITQADDEGRGLADPRRFKAQIFPGDDEATPERIAAWLAECVAQGLVITYDGGPKLGPLYEIPTWNAHQKIDRRVSSRFPKPNGAGPKSSPAPVEIIKPTADSSRTRRGLVEDSATTRRLIGSGSGSGSGSDLSVSSAVTVARARESGPDHFKKMGLETRIRPKRRTRDRPGGLATLGSTLDSFLVEHTPEWAKVAQ